MPHPSASLLADTYDAHAAALLLYARSFVDAALAEDLLHDAFLRLAALSHTPDNPRAWLLTTLRHAALDALKSSRRRLARHSRAAAQTPLFAPAPAADFLPAELHTALAALPITLREILTLRLWNDATFAQIASLTNLPLSTVHHHYTQALQTLKTRWETPCPTK